LKGRFSAPLKIPLFLLIELSICRTQFRIEMIFSSARTGLKGPFSIIVRRAIETRPTYFGMTRGSILAD